MKRTVAHRDLKPEKVLKSRDGDFVTKIPQVTTFKPSRPSQAVNCFDGSCGRCKNCQGSYGPDPERWWGGS